MNGGKENLLSKSCFRAYIHGTMDYNVEWSITVTWYPLLAEDTILPCNICVCHRTVLLSIPVIWSCRRVPSNQMPRFDGVWLLMCFSYLASHVNPESHSSKAGVCQPLLYHALIDHSPTHCLCLWSGKTHIISDRNSPE